RRPKVLPSLTHIPASTPFIILVPAKAGSHRAALDPLKNGSRPLPGPKFTRYPTTARSGEFALRRKDGLFLRDDIEDPILAFVNVEDELADEGLVILLTQRLVALREVVAFLQFETFQRLDQLWRVFASTKSRFLHSELERV